MYKGERRANREIGQMRDNRLKEILRPKAYKELMKFMEGQTIDANGVYEDDFMRWFYKQEVID